MYIHAYIQADTLKGIFISMYIFYYTLILQIRVLSTISIFNLFFLGISDSIYTFPFYPESPRHQLHQYIYLFAE